MGERTMPQRGEVWRERGKGSTPRKYVLVEEVDERFVYPIRNTSRRRQAVPIESFVRLYHLCHTADEVRGIHLGSTARLFGLTRQGVLDRCGLALDLDVHGSEADRG